MGPGYEDREDAEEGGCEEVGRAFEDLFDPGVARLHTERWSRDRRVEVLIQARFHPRDSQDPQFDAARNDDAPRPKPEAHRSPNEVACQGSKWTNTGLPDSTALLAARA